MSISAQSQSNQKVSRPSLPELIGRLDNFRSIMADNGIDVAVLTTPESVYYLSGYYTRAMTSLTALIITSAGHVRLVTRQIDEGNFMRIQALSTVTEFTAFTDDQMESSPELIAGLARQYLGSGSIGLEPNGIFVSPSDFFRMRDALGDIKVIDVGLIINRLRLVKSAWELDCHREAGKMTCDAMSRTIEAVAVGKTDSHVAAVAAESIVRSGSEWMATWPIVMTGSETGRSHSSWQGQTIEAGSPTTLEFSSVRHRYHSPSYRTVIHSPSDEQVAMSHAIGEAHQAILAALTAGNSAESVFQAKQRVLNSSAWPNLSKARAGYTVGMSFAPNWVQRNSVDLMDGNKTLLLPGMVFHAITAIIDVNKFSIAHSSTVIITENGVEDLTVDGHDMPVLIR